MKKSGYDSNDEVTFDVTFKNNSDDTIEDLRMYDASSLNFIKELNKIEVIESDSQAYPVGTTISEINGKDYAVPWPDECFYVDFKGINLGTNEMIKLRYTASVKSNSSGDILNTVGFMSVHNSDFSSFDYGKAEVTVPRRDLNLTKQIYDSLEKEYTDSMNVKINDSISDIYTYKVTLNGVNNSNNTSYIGKTIHVKDVIPENMEYVDGSVKMNSNMSFHIKNTEIIGYKISVTKLMNSEGIKSAVFYAGLYIKSDDREYTLIEKKSVSAGDTIEFSNLDVDKTYYIFECDSNGNIVSDIFSGVVTDYDDNEVEKEFKVFYPDCGDLPITFGNDDKKSVTIRNIISEYTEIQITKNIYTDNPQNIANTSFRFGIYTSDGNDTYFKQGEVSVDLTAQDSFTLDGNGMYTLSKTAKFTNLELGTTYYIFELDEDGKRIENGNKAEINGTDYLVDYNSASNMFVIDGNSAGKFSVTNTSQKNVEIKISKTDVNGEPFENAELTLLYEGGVISSWNTSDEPVKLFRNLDAGTYTVTEKAIAGYRNLSAKFSIDSDGYIITDSSDSDSISLTADTAVLVNKSEISISKQDSVDSNELEGALITIAILVAFAVIRKPPG